MTGEPVREPVPGGSELRSCWRKPFKGSMLRPFLWPSADTSRCIRGFSATYEPTVLYMPNNVPCPNPLNG